MDGKSQNSKSLNGLTNITADDISVDTLEVDTITLNNITLNNGVANKYVKTDSNKKLVTTSEVPVLTTTDQTVGGNKTFSNTIQGSVSGNAQTATTLETARNIAGQSFNGSANIDIASTDLSNTADISLLNVEQTNTSKKTFSGGIVATSINSGGETATFGGNVSAQKFVADDVECKDIDTASTDNLELKVNGTRICRVQDTGLYMEIGKKVSSQNIETTEFTAMATSGGVDGEQSGIKVKNSGINLLFGDTTTASSGDGNKWCMFRTTSTAPRDVEFSNLSTGASRIVLKNTEGSYFLGTNADKYEILKSSSNTDGSFTRYQILSDGTHVFVGTVTAGNGFIGDVTGNADTSTKTNGINTTSDGFVKTTSGNGTISVGDLVSGDIPNNGADTTGNAGSVTNGVYTTGNQFIGGSKTFTSPIVGHLNGEANTATQLHTARTIAGVSFNGSQNIDIPSTGLSDSDQLIRTNTVSQTISTADTTNLNIKTTGGTSKDAELILETGEDKVKIALDAGDRELKIYYDYNGTYFERISLNRWGAVTLKKLFLNDDFQVGGASDFKVTESNGNTVIGGTLNVAGTITGTLSGNALTAITLQTARNIAGQSFNGSADITIASGDLTDTANIALLSGTQTFTGTKTFSADLLVGSAGNQTKYPADDVNNTVIERTATNMRFWAGQGTGSGSIYYFTGMDDNTNSLQINTGGTSKHYITSTTGVISFDNENIETSGNITGDRVYGETFEITKTDGVPYLYFTNQNNYIYRISGGTSANDFIISKYYDPDSGESACNFFVYDESLALLQLKLGKLTNEKTFIFGVATAGTHSGKQYLSTENNELVLCDSASNLENLICGNISSTDGFSATMSATGDGLVIKSRGSSGNEIPVMFGYSSGSTFEEDGTMAMCIGNSTSSRRFHIRNAGTGSAILKIGNSEGIYGLVINDDEFKLYQYSTGTYALIVDSSKNFDFQAGSLTTTSSITAGSLVTPSITSATGTIDMGDDNITTTGDITCDDITPAEILNSSTQSTTVNIERFKGSQGLPVWTPTNPAIPLGSGSYQYTNKFRLQIRPRDFCNDDDSNNKYNMLVTQDSSSNGYSYGGVYQKSTTAQEVFVYKEIPHQCKLVGMKIVTVHRLTQTGIGASQEVEIDIFRVSIMYPSEIKEYDNLVSTPSEKHTNEEITFTDSSDAFFRTQGPYNQNPLIIVGLDNGSSADAVFKGGYMEFEKI